MHFPLISVLINIFDKVRLGILLLASLFTDIFRLAVQHYIPASTGDNSMDSDEEIKLMSEVEDLETQLKQAGHPIRKEYSDIFLNNDQTKPTPADRIPKFRNQIQALRQRLERHSGRAAVSPVVAHHYQTQKDRKRKAPDSQHEPEIQSHVAGAAVQVK